MCVLRKPRVGSDGSQSYRTRSPTVAMRLRLVLGQGVTKQSLLLMNTAGMESYSDFAGVRKIKLRRLLKLLKLSGSVVSSVQEPRFTLRRLPRSSKYAGKAFRLEQLLSCKSCRLLNLPKPDGSAVSALQTLRSNRCRLPRLQKLRGNQFIRLLALKLNCYRLLMLPTLLHRIVRWDLLRSSCCRLFRLPNVSGRLSSLQQDTICNCSRLRNAPKLSGRLDSFIQCDRSSCSSAVKLPKLSGKDVSARHLLRSSFFSAVQVSIATCILASFTR